MDVKEFFEHAKKVNAKMLDLKFVDLLGTWQHCSFTIDDRIMGEKEFTDGFSFNIF